MPWNMYYNGNPVLRGLDLATMTSISDNVLEMLAANHATWFDIQRPNGDGISFDRLLITPGIPISFHEESLPSGFGFAGKIPLV